MGHFKVTLWMTYLLIQFCGLSYSCGSAYYENNGHCCPLCSSGAHVYKHCTKYTSTSCVPCSQKSFNDEPNGRLNCYPCTGCDPAMGLKTYKECTSSSDAVCGPLDHHYCTETDNKGRCTFAQNHTTCGPGQLIKKEGTKTVDTQCEECPHGYFSADGVNCTAWTKCNFDQQKTAEGTKTNDTVCENIPERSRLWILGPVLLTVVLCAGIIGICFKKGRKNQLMAPVQETQERPSENLL